MGSQEKGKQGKSLFQLNVREEFGYSRVCTLNESEDSWDGGERTDDDWWEIKDDQKWAQNNVVNIIKIEVVYIIKLNQCMKRNEINGVR